MAGKTFVRLDKIQASVYGNIESVVHTADLENGMVCFLGSLATNERELFNVKTPLDATIITDSLYLIASPEVMYDERLYRLEDFYIAIGTPARAYLLQPGDKFTVSDNAITGASVLDQFVVPTNGTLRLTAAAADPGVDVSRFLGKVIRKETWNGVACTVIQVLRN